MSTIKPILSLAIFLLSVSPCFGQDTVKVEPSIHYTRAKDPIRGKAFAAKVRYAREDIVFSDTHQRIEYCYYYDGERHCHGINYRLTGDSTLDMDGETWHFSRQGDRYLLERSFQGTYESGLAQSLIPLATAGRFTTTTADRIDTLWTTDYAADQPANPYDSPRWQFHRTKIAGKIYTPDEIDTPPTLANGDTLKAIHLNRSDGCFSEPYYQVRELKFVVTQAGRIVNIEQSIGNLDLDSCPYYFMDLIRYLCQAGPLNPAKANGQPVPVLWTLPVIMDTEAGQK